MLHRLFDTGENKEVREAAYPGADVVLLCVPVEDLHTDVEALKSQLKEFTDEVDMTRTVLVGMKSDLKKDDGSSANGWNLVKELSAQNYLECSSTSKDDSIQELFKGVITLLNTKKNKKTMLLDVKER